MQLISPLLLILAAGLPGVAHPEAANAAAPETAAFSARPEHQEPPHASGGLLATEAPPVRLCRGHGNAPQSCIRVPFETPYPSMGITRASIGATAMARLTFVQRLRRFNGLLTSHSSQAPPHLRV